MMDRDRFQSRLKAVGYDFPLVIQHFESYANVLTCVQILPPKFTINK